MDCAFLIFRHRGKRNVSQLIECSLLPCSRIDNTVSGNFTNGIAASFISAPFVSSFFRSSLPLAVTSLPGNIVRATMIGFLAGWHPLLRDQRIRDRLSIYPSRIEKDAHTRPSRIRNLARMCRLSRSIRQQKFQHFRSIVHKEDRGSSRWFAILPRGRNGSRTARAFLQLFL